MNNIDAEPKTNSISDFTGELTDPRHTSQSSPLPKDSASRK